MDYENRMILPSWCLCYCSSPVLVPMNDRTLSSGLVASDIPGTSGFINVSSSSMPRSLLSSESCQDNQFFHLLLRLFIY